MKSTTAKKAADVKGKANAGGGEKRFTSWSYSRYSEYKMCPLKAKLNHLDKIKEPGSDAMERGNVIHRVAELYVKGASFEDIGDGGDPLRKPTKKAEGGSLYRFAAEFKELRARYAKAPQGMTVETTWAFRRNWTRTKWNDWDECALRIKVDLGVVDDVGGKKRLLVMTVTDWKTGKFREQMKDDYLEQLELYALGALLYFPDLDEVRPRLAYVDLGLFHPLAADALVYRRADLPGLKALWDKRTRAMLLDRSFAPRPNDKCRWCHYRNDNKENGGGQCRF